MKKIFLFTSLFMFFGVIVFVFHIFPVSASTTYAINTVQTEKYMYMSHPSDGDVYVFDNKNNGQFVKKIQVATVGYALPLNMEVYTSNTVSLQNYILVAMPGIRSISIIDDETLSVVGNISTAKKPYDLAVTSDGYIIMTISRDNPSDFYPMSIKISEDAEGIPQREPGTADIDWLTSNDKFGGNVPIGNERLNLTMVGSGGLMIFGLDPMSTAFVTFEISNGVPGIISAPGPDEYAYSFSDYDTDIEFFDLGYYVGNEGDDSNKVQVIGLGDNDKATEFELDNNTNSVASYDWNKVLVGVSADNFEHDIFMYTHDTDGYTHEYSESESYLLPDSGHLLKGGISTSNYFGDPNNIPAYAVTNYYVYWLNANGGAVPVYDFAYNSGDRDVFMQATNLVARNITQTSAEVCWEYDYPSTEFYIQWGESDAALSSSNSQVYIQPYNNCYTITGLDPTGSVGLSPGTRYYVHIKSALTDLLDYMPAESDIISFTTLEGEEDDETLDKPDLTITDISFESENDQVGEVGFLTITLKNNGATFDGTRDMFYADNYPPDFGAFDPVGSVIMDRDFPLGGDITFDEGEEMILKWEGVFGSAGNHLIYYVVDYLDLLDEESETNNQLREFISISSGDDEEDETDLPDLTVTEISFNSANQRVGELGRLSVTIQNLGGELTSSLAFESWANDADFGAFQMSSLSGVLNSYTSDRAMPSLSVPLETNQSITMTWRGSFPDVGSPIVYYNIDSQNIVRELDENNNQFHAYITIIDEDEDLSDFPDLIVGDIKFGYGDVSARDISSVPSNQFFVEFYYKNKTDNPISFGEFQATISIDGNEAEARTLNIPVGENPASSDIFYGGKLDLDLDNGYHIIAIRLNSDGVLRESDSENNIKKKKIKVEGEREAEERTEEEKVEARRETIKEMIESASRLFNDSIDDILEGIKETQDDSREEQARSKYLTKLITGLKRISNRAQNALSRFIAYGVDDNTKRLGEGERAAVVYSYKAAFGKVPETEDEMADAIKIANGRWPSVTNKAAEDKAKAHFVKIYDHEANMDEAHENAAVTIMAYGLRQRAENRNLESEKAGIKSFVHYYGYHPASTEDWNVMQAITYSGSIRGADSDRDLLTDAREAELGTDPNNPDSDGDGYGDGQEVANGYNPNGEGTLADYLLTL